MPLESATFVNQLDQTRPTATDVKSEGDDVMRLIKSTLKSGAIDSRRLSGLLLSGTVKIRLELDLFVIVSRVSIATRFVYT